MVLKFQSSHRWMPFVFFLAPRFNFFLVALWIQQSEKPEKKNWKLKKKHAHRTDDDRERHFPFQIEPISHKSKSIRTIQKFIIHFDGFVCVMHTHIFSAHIECARNESLNGKLAYRNRTTKEERKTCKAWSDINVIKFCNFTSFASFLDFYKFTVMQKPYLVRSFMCLCIFCSILFIDKHFFSHFKRTSVFMCFKFGTHHFDVNTHIS